MYLLVGSTTVSGVTRIPCARGQKGILRPCFLSELCTNYKNDSEIWCFIRVGDESRFGKEQRRRKINKARNEEEWRDEWRGPSPRRSAWATQLRRNVAAVASRWRHCADLTGPGIEPQTSHTNSVRLATELTAGVLICLRSLKCFLE